MVSLDKLENVEHARNLFELKPWTSLIKTITHPMITQFLRTPMKIAVKPRRADAARPE